MNSSLLCRYTTPDEFIGYYQLPGTLFCIDYMLLSIVGIKTAPPVHLKKPPSISCREKHKLLD